MSEETSDLQATNQTCRETVDEHQSNQIQTCKKKTAQVLTSFFTKVENQDVEPESAIDDQSAQIKFEFALDSVVDEQSPKTPEFSEIVENSLEKTVM